METVMAGGDTDTNAAIAGALPTTPCPRPQCLWPVDVEELAERLLQGEES